MTIEPKVEIHVGETAERVANRAIEAWHAMERGDELDERHVGFESWEAMIRVMTPERIALLRHLHRRPAASVQALALALGRDVKTVAEDVEALAAAALLDRDEDSLRADYGALDLRMQLAL